MTRNLEVHRVSYFMHFRIEAANNAHYVRVDTARGKDNNYSRIYKKNGNVISQRI